jgi:hypothetical protein
LNRWGQAIATYRDDVVAELRPRMVLLYGSQATGQAGPHSDIDIIVVSDHLPTYWHDRIGLLNQLNRTRAPTEALGYTSEEFERMLRKGHVTALDGMYQGIVLYGEDYYREMRAIFDAMVERGLERTFVSWKLPADVAAS